MSPQAGRQKFFPNASARHHEGGEREGEHRARKMSHRFAPGFRFGLTAKQSRQGRAAATQPPPSSSKYLRLFTQPGPFASLFERLLSIANGGITDMTNFVVRTYVFALFRGKDPSHPSPRARKGPCVARRASQPRCERHRAD